VALQVALARSGNAAPGTTRRAARCDLGAIHGEGPGAVVAPALAVEMRCEIDVGPTCAANEATGAG
jgi:hypothetical protein